MIRRQKAKAVTRESFYQPSWMAALLALAAAVLLAWHGMARAETSDAPPPVQSTEAASPEDAAPNPACTDAMDITPEDAETSPFDADEVAFRAHGKALRALKVLYGSCQGDSVRVSSS